MRLLGIIERVKKSFIGEVSPEVDKKIGDWMELLSRNIDNLESNERVKLICTIEEHLREFEKKPGVLNGINDGTIKEFRDYLNDLKVTHNIR